MTFMNIIIVDMITRMYVGGHLQATFNSCHCAHICVRVVTTSITQQVDLPSHLQNSEQASCAEEQLHLCEEHGLSLLQLQLISEGAISTLLGSDTGQYAHDGPSDAHPNSSRSSSGGSCCNAAFQMQA